jgi:hypothetical protein
MPDASGEFFLYTEVAEKSCRGSVMRILLADRESGVRYGLRVFLEEQSEFQVVGEAADIGSGSRNRKEISK